MKNTKPEVSCVKWRRFLIIIAVSILVALSATVWNQLNYERSRLTIATAPDFCPYEFIDPASGNAALIGFDIDLAKAIADSMDYTPTFETMPFTQLVPAVRSQRADIAIAAITPTEERQKVVNFSSVYYEARSLIITRNGSAIQSLPDLSGKRIGVKPGTVHEQVAMTVSDVEVVPFDHTSDTLQELKTGRIDGALIDRAIARKHINRQSEFKRSDFKRIVLDNEQPAGVAIAAPKNSDLLTPIDSTLKRLRQNGTIDELILKWFDDYVCTPSEQA